jgi:hypothetical protein
VRFGRRSAKGPDQGASATNATRNEACSAGTYHARTRRRVVIEEQHRDGREEDRVVSKRGQELRAEQNADSRDSRHASLAARQLGLD